MRGSAGAYRAAHTTIAFDLHLVFKAKFNVKARGTTYRPAVTSTRVPKLSHTKTSLPEEHQ